MKAVVLPDSLSLSDLHTFLGRAAVLEDGAARLVANGDVLAVSVGVLYPAGLLDSSATVIGFRAFALAEPVDIDAVVSVRALVERLVRLQNDVVDPTAAVAFLLPPTTVAASWSAISAPRSGWEPVGELDPVILEAAATAGISEVAAAIPTGTGEQIVHRVRTEVWSRPVDGSDVPAGAAFAAVTLGFLAPDEPVRVFAAATWARLSTSRGHVLVKRRGGSLLG